MKSFPAAKTYNFYVKERIDGMARKVTAETIMEQFAQKNKLLLSFYHKEESVRRSFSEDIQRLGQALPEKCLFVYVDCAAFDDFTEIIHHVSITILQDEKLQPEDTNVDIEDLDVEDSAEVCLQFGSLMVDLGEADCHLMIVLDHFEATPDYWTAAEYGWLRQVFDSNVHASCLLIAPVFASEVTLLPVGSSAFYNIFSSAEPEGEK